MNFAEECTKFLRKFLPLFCGGMYKEIAEVSPFSDRQDCQKIFFLETLQRYFLPVVGLKGLDD